MRTSEAGIAFNKQWERFAPHPYYCQAGVLTIGYGHTNRSRTQPPVSAGMAPITEPQADAILRNDLRPCEARVSSLVGEHISQAMFDMLVSFDFNSHGLTLGNGELSGVTRAARHGDPHAVTRELSRWVYITDPRTGAKLISNGLVNRRHAEAAFIMAGSNTWQTETHAMPQEVIEPEPPKSMLQSTTGNVSTGLGFGGTAQLGVDVAQAAQKPTWTDFAITLAHSYTFWIAVGTIAGAVYLWFGHRHRLRWGYA